MERSFALVLQLFAAVWLNAQHTDTLRFHSNAFGGEREVLVRLPEFHRYAASDVRFPVIIVLDGQHEWFIDPVLNDIRYLEYTHEVPPAIVVTVPLADRVKECAPDSIHQPDMPLLRMLTEELPTVLRPYHPSEIQILVGHSFSASFAVYAYLRAPRSFDAIIALSPLHLMKEALPQLVAMLSGRPNERVYVALGGAHQLKDGGHFDRLAPSLRALDLGRANGQLVYREYPSAGHTSIPIVAFPELISTLFMPFAIRDTLVPVDDAYQLRAPPPAPDVLLQEVRSSLGFLESSIAWDIAEINGMASRLLSSGYEAHARAVFERGIALYPKLYEFHWSLGELLLEVDRKAAMASLQRALDVLDREEADLPERKELRMEIEAMMR